MPGMLLHHEKRLDVFMSGTFFVIGFSPITALAVAIFGLLPLPVNTLLIVLPATVLGIGLALRFPTYGKLALKGLLLGLIAVFLYDCMRYPFIIAGVWGDFIKVRRENHEVFSLVDEAPHLTLDWQCSCGWSPDWHCQSYNKSTHHSKRFVLSSIPAVSITFIHLPEPKGGRLF